MAHTANVETHLIGSGTAYTVVQYAPVNSVQGLARQLGISPHAILQAMLLKDEDGYLLAVLPSDAIIDFAMLHEGLGRQMWRASSSEMAHFFGTNNSLAVAPFGELYGMAVVIDAAVYASPLLYLVDPAAHSVLRISGADFKRLHVGARQLSFTRPGGTLEAMQAVLEPEDKPVPLRVLPLADIREHVRTIKRLPAMPDIAQRILQLRADPDAEIAEVAQLVEQDPGLAAQVVRYARSPLFGYQGKIRTIQEAITRVLGLDLVMNIAFGIAAGRAFRAPHEGPLGLGASWRHALYTATLMEALSKQTPRKLQLRPGVAYLAGLLHNLGFLILGHYFPAHFALLNRLVENNPNRFVGQIERLVLGMGHHELGAVLMESWNLPSEVIAVVAHHHEPDYAGEHASYVALTLIANRLLRSQNIGDEVSSELPARLLDVLGLDAETSLQTLGRVMEGRVGLDLMARDMAA